MTGEQDETENSSSVWDDPSLVNIEAKNLDVLLSESQASAWSNNELKKSFSAPPLPPGRKPPTLLIIDDEDEFNKGLHRQLKHYYPNQARLVTINPNTEDPRVRLLEMIEQGHSPDAIYIDVHMPQGMQNGYGILAQLRKIPAAHYIPIVLMTTNPEGTEDRRALSEGAQRFMYKPGDAGVSAYFLHQAILIVEQLQDQMEDQRWIDINTDVGKWLADGRNVSSFYDEIITRLNGFNLFGSYIRLVSTTRVLELKGGSDCFNAGLKIDLSDAPPFMVNLLNENGPLSFKSDALPGEDSGAMHPKTNPWKKKLLGMRVIAAVILFSRERMGTITLYRSNNNDSRPFRHKDKSFLVHLAQQIGAGLGRELRDDTLRRREIALADFAKTISSLENEQDVLNNLGDYLHQELQRNGDQHAKTSIRLVEPSTGELSRKYLRGLPAKDLKITLTREDAKKSVYAQVVRDGKTTRSGDVNKDLKDAFLTSNQNINSCLTVPLIASEHRLGAVNLENVNKEWFSKDDETFADSLCRMAATMLIHLRARKFLAKLLDWSKLAVLPIGIGEDRLLPEAFSLLAEFTRFSYLLFLVPTSSNEQNPWALQYVLDSHGEPISDDALPKWKDHLKRVWTSTYIRDRLDFTVKNLVNPSDGFSSLCNLEKSICLFQTNESYAADNPMGFNTESMVLLQFLSSDTPRRILGIMEMLFPTVMPLNSYEMELCTTFGEFISALWRGQGKYRKLFDEFAITAQDRMLQERLSSFQHKIRSRMSKIAMALGELREIENSEMKEHLDTISKVLSETRVEERNLGRLIKKTDPKDFSVREVWGGVLKEISTQVKEREVSIRPVTGVNDINWFSDPEIIADILFTLVQNALEQPDAKPGFLIVLDIALDTEKEQLRLSVKDNGQGVPEHLQPNLFHRGFSTKPHGTGFGLEFCRRRTRDLGGDLTYSPVHPHGASFNLLLPRFAKG
ncbi:MAG: ATP-binding protein [Magnetococcus sp. DMHC-1]